MCGAKALVGFVAFRAATPRRSHSGRGQCLVWLNCGLMMSWPQVELETWGDSWPERRANVQREVQVIECSRARFVWHSNRKAWSDWQRTHLLCTAAYSPCFLGIGMFFGKYCLKESVLLLKQICIVHKLENILT